MDASSWESARAAAMEKIRARILGSRTRMPTLVDLTIDSGPVSAKADASSVSAKEAERDVTKGDATKRRVEGDLEPPVEASERDWHLKCALESSRSQAQRSPQQQEAKKSETSVPLPPPATISWCWVENDTRRADCSLIGRPLMQGLGVKKKKPVIPSPRSSKKKKDSTASSGVAECTSGNQNCRELRRIMTARSEEKGELSSTTIANVKNRFAPLYVENEAEEELQEDRLAQTGTSRGVRSGVVPGKPCRPRVVDDKLPQQATFHPSGASSSTGSRASSRRSNSQSSSRNGNSSSQRRGDDEGARRRRSSDDEGAVRSSRSPCPTSDRSTPAGSRGAGDEATRGRGTEGPPSMFGRPPPPRQPPPPPPRMPPAGDNAAAWLPVCVCRSRLSPAPIAWPERVFSLLLLSTFTRVFANNVNETGSFYFLHNSVSPKSKTRRFDLKAPVIDPLGNSTISSSPAEGRPASFLALSSTAECGSRLTPKPYDPRQGPPQKPVVPGTISRLLRRTLRTLRSPMTMSSIVLFSDELYNSEQHESGHHRSFLYRVPQIPTRNDYVYESRKLFLRSTETMIFPPNGVPTSI